MHCYHYWCREYGQFLYWLTLLYSHKQKQQLLLHKKLYIEAEVCTQKITILRSATSAQFWHFPAITQFLHESCAPLQKLCDRQKMSELRKSCAAQDRNFLVRLNRGKQLGVRIMMKPWMSYSPFCTWTVLRSERLQHSQPAWHLCRELVHVHYILHPLERWLWQALWQREGNSQNPQSLQHTTMYDYNIIIL